MAGSTWERFTHDPRDEEHARLRASDGDRDIVNDVLGTAYAEGRLTPEELDERSDQVVRAKTLGELPPIMDDLVVRSTNTAVVRDKRAEAERRYLQERKQALFTFLTPSLICWAIWFAAGMHFPWPIFVMIGTGMRLVQLLASREEVTRSIERNLEKKERKRLEAKQRKELGGKEGPDDPQVNQG